MPDEPARPDRHFKPPWLILSAVVGLAAGLGAVILIRLIALVADGSSFVEDHLGRFVLLVTIPLGIAAAATITNRYAPEVAGHGVPRIIAALTVAGGRMRTRVAPLKAVATALTIGVGGSVGREGSIAQIGAAVGSWLGRAFRLGEDDVRILVAAGAGAGISATFNAPIAGMLFALEVILAEFSAWNLHTVLIASVAGAVVSHSLLGEELIFQVPAHSLLDPSELLLYGALGLAVVAVGILFLYALDLTEQRHPPVPRWAQPIVLGLVVAAFIVAFPRLRGSGANLVEELLRGDVTIVWWLLLILAPMKAIVSSLTLGARGAGGIFMPSLFMGATTGAGLARLLQPVWTFSAIQPGAFALVGMAAAFAAVARAPLTAIVIVFETTGDYGLVLPLMVATSIATFLANRFHPESAYTAPLIRMGVHPTHRGGVDLLDTVTVGEVADRRPITISSDASLEDADDLMARRRSHGIPVVDEGHLVGIVTGGDVSRGRRAGKATVAEAMTRAPATVTKASRVSEAVARMAALGVGRLPVVDADAPDRLVGMFGRTGAVEAYHRALAGAARARRPPELFRPPGVTTGTFEVEVPADSIADGRRIRDVSWPEGCLVIAVQRGAQVFLAKGETEVQAHDMLTVAGTPESARRLRERLTEFGGQEEQTPDAD